MTSTLKGARAHLVDVFGASFFTSDEPDLRFITPAFAGGEPSACGAVVGAAGTRLNP